MFSTFNISFITTIHNDRDAFAEKLIVNLKDVSSLCLLNLSYMK